MTLLPTGACRAAVLATLLALSLAGCKTTSTPGAPAVERTSADLDDTLKGDQDPPKGFERTVVDYPTKEKPGTVIIDTREKHLYLVQSGGKALRYGVGVGREGFGWKGAVEVNSKQEWPKWHPPKEMIARERARGKTLPEVMDGGPGNPLGARALYLWQDNRDTLYRIHGTNEPETIGRSASSGCIRMRNIDAIDLFNRVPVGAKVIVV